MDCPRLAPPKHNFLMTVYGPLSPSTAPVVGASVDIAVDRSSAGGSDSIVVRAHAGPRRGRSGLSGSGCGSSAAPSDGSLDNGLDISSPSSSASALTAWLLRILNELRCRFGETGGSLGDGRVDPGRPGEDIEPDRTVLGQHLLCLIGDRIDPQRHTSLGC